MSGGLALDRISAGYGDHAVVRALSLTPWPAGRVTALIGPNGAGKSTLLRAVAGLIPSRGSIRLDDPAQGGLDLGAMSVAARARHVAYMPQTLPQDVALTVLETVIAALEASPAQAGDGPAPERAMAALERAGAAELALQRMDRLSGGQRQIAGLAQALVRQPRVLLLDEPTSALDLRRQLEVLDLARDYARERDAVAVMVLHDLQAAARIADHVVVMNGGGVHVQGAPAEAVTPEVLAEVWQVRARVEASPEGRLQLLVDGVV